MTTSGTGVYFDGLTSRRQDVHVALEGALVLIRPDGVKIETWPYADLREVCSPPGMLRLTRQGGAELARLEIGDTALAAMIRVAAPKLGAARKAEAGTARKVVAWSVAAVVSLTIFGVYGIPALADRLAPILPWSLDQRMGRAADGQIRAIFSDSDSEFACGTGSEEKPGRDALDRLAKTLSDAAALPVPIEIVAVRNGFVNALALPGGVIYLFDGLIERTEGVDELAGVLAHEIGHVAHRDGSRRALQAGGVSLLFGFILGDFVGGTAAVAIVRTLADASYSRTAERDADAYAVALMKRLGGDPKAMGRMLLRLATAGDKDDAKEKSEGENRSDEKPAPAPKTETDEPPDRKPARSITSWIASHPNTAERAQDIDALAGDGPTAPLLDAADFLAIKRICGRKP